MALLIKVCQVTHTFLPDYIGGREVHVKNLSDELSRQGVNVQILTGKGKNAAHHDLIDNNLTVIRTPLLNIPLSQHPSKINLRVLPWLPFSLLGIDADIVHAHDYYQSSSTACSLVSRFSHKPLVLSVHSNLGFFNINKMMVMTDWVYNHSVGKLTLKQPKKVIFMSHYSAKEYLQNGLVCQGQVAVIHPGINDKEFVNDSLRLANKGYSYFAKKFGFKDNPVILSVGRIEQRKGIQFVLQAMSDLVRDFPQLQLVIIGPDSGYASELKRLAGELGIKQHVFFTGQVSDEEVKEAMSDASVFILPSELENFPEVILRVACFGKPIIASNTGGISEFIKAGKNGLLVKVGDVNDFISAIKSVLLDEELAKNIGGQARRDVFKDFTISRMANKTKILYEGVLAAK